MGAILECTYKDIRSEQCMLNNDLEFAYDSNNVYYLTKADAEFTMNTIINTVMYTYYNILLKC